MDLVKCIDMVERKLKELSLSMFDSFYFLCEVEPRVTYWGIEIESEVE